MGELTATPIRKAERFYEPFVSPDGRWIGFNDEVDYTLKKISVTGGPPVSIAAIGREVYGASWGPDDTIVFATSQAGTGLWRVGAAGGKPVVLTTPDKARGELSHCWPQFLPGGRAVLYTIRSGARASDFQIAAIDLATNVQTILVPGGSSSRYLSSGHLIYGAEGTLRAVRFDPASLKVQGNSISVLEEVATKASGGVDFDVAADGTLVYVSGAGSAGRRLVWVDRKGVRTAINAEPRSYVHPRISPDGKRVAVQSQDQENDIWIYDCERGTLTRLTDDPALDAAPVWMPNGRRVAFYSARLGTPNLFSQAVDGSGGLERLTDSPNLQVPSSFSPDGSQLVFREDTGAGSDLMMLQLDGSHRTKPLVRTKATEWNGEVSPDGKWLAYQSNISTRWEIYLRPFPATEGEAWTVSTGGGIYPAWARGSSAELFYQTPDGRLMSVKIRGDSASPAGTPQLVLDQHFFMTTNRAYDVSPDGKRFLMIDDSGGGPDAANAAGVVVVLNWAEEIKAKLPPAKR
jgi:serine/threonine-protein kinase